MNKGKNTAKGITLIALVITIIVMLILVGVTISMALNGGLFGYAKKAARDTESQKQLEQELASGAVTIDGVKYDSMQDYMNGFPSGTPKAKPIDEVEKTENGILKENGAYTSDGKTAIIPKGFKIIADENGEKSIGAGLVIQDEAENEYVWIPVDDGKLDRTEWKNNEPTGTISSEYTETLPKDLENSVKTNKGFYIGRYEAGSITVRTEAGKDNLTDVLTKKGLYPYNFVKYDDAVDQTAKMYADKTKYGVEDILPYGAMWDETMKFVKDTNNVTNSTTWGNYFNNSFTFNGKYSSDFGKTWSEEKNNETKPGANDNPTNWLLTTGACETNKAKNIYDLAGNVLEWTQESSSTTLRVLRGGVWQSVDLDNPASRRSADSPTITTGAIGFRPALYIK